MQLPIYIKKTGRSITANVDQMIGDNVDLSTFLASESTQSWLEYVLERSPSLKYALMYGLTQSVNDAHAALTLAGDGAEKVMAAAEKKLAAIIAGTVKVRGVTRTHADPIMHEAMKLARAWWKGQSDTKKQVDIGKMRVRKDEYNDLNDEQIVEIILEVYAHIEKTWDKAQAIVAANSIEVDEDFDLDDIMPDDSE